MMPRSSTTGKGGTGHLTRTDGKTYCLDTGNTNAVEIKCVAMRGRGNDNLQQLEERKDYKTNCLTNVQKDNLILAGDYRTDEGFRWNKEGKSPTLMARAREDISSPPLINTPSIRRLTPLECERLQGMKDNYTNHVSDSQRYKMIGNGWTIPVISHLFNYIK
jgi:DNA (cytosine-5)-methyltransferase 3A